jgi:hypothetical protein
MKRKILPYRARRVRNTAALWRLLERRDGRYVCVAIGTPALKELAAKLCKR